MKIAVIAGLATLLMTSSAVAERAIGPVASINAFLATTTLTPASAAAVDRRCASALALGKSVQALLEARRGPSTASGDLSIYDALTNELSSIGSEMNVISSANPDKAIRDAADSCQQKTSDALTAISLSRPIYDRISAIRSASLDKTTADYQKRLVRDFKLAGVDKDQATRAKVTELQSQITKAGVEFDRNIAEDKSEITLKSADDLEGLPQDYIASHKPGADGLIHISTSYPDAFPLLKFAKKEDVRKAMFVAFSNRAYPSNGPVLKELLQKRQTLAQTLGYPDYASLVTADKMIGSPEHAMAFLKEVSEAAEPASERDLALLLAAQKEFAPDEARLEPWNRSYVTNIVTKSKFDVDQAEVRKYFTYANARDGIFGLIHDLFGAEIRPWNARMWDKSVETYSLYNRGKLVGHFFLDMHPRPGKYSHAATFFVRRGLASGQLPIGGLICNFPAEGPMEHSDVTTFLHEFGHLIHFLYSGHQRYSGEAMDSLQWDFIESPSQLLEEWTWDYDTLSRFAKDKNGNTIPKSLVAKMNAARHFGEALGWKRQIGYAVSSLAYHTKAGADDDLDTTWVDSYDQYADDFTVPGTHDWAAFGHLNGYSAIYYTYVWSKAIALDLASRFKAAGMRDRATALAYRKSVLDPGGSVTANQLIRGFLGRDMTTAAFEKELTQ